MGAIPEFRYCDILAEFVCKDEKCNYFVLKDKIADHIRRQHAIKPTVARREAKRLTDSVLGKEPHPISTRYLEDPYPREGEQPLKALSVLPIGDIVKFPWCTSYYKAANTCRVHVRNSHANHPEYESAVQKLCTLPVMKGQTIFTRPEQKRWFPVSVSSVEITRSALTNFDKNAEELNKSDKTSLQERSSNLSSTILGIPDFLDYHNIKPEEAYNLIRIDDHNSYSRLAEILFGYIQHFANNRTHIPVSVVEGVKIRNDSFKASFSLAIKEASKQRYSRSVARFVILASRLGESRFTNVLSDQTLISHANHTTNARALLLGVSRASEGGTVALEGLFKFMMSGYTCALNTGRARIAGSEDASHSAACLQFFCHLAALGEYFLPPTGFGSRTGEEEQPRMQRIQAMLITEACTPAAYLRQVLRKSKRISTGESPNVTFAICNEHSFCGLVNNIEVQMNSDRAGSLGFAIRSITRDVDRIIREVLMLKYKIPAGFTSTVLSFPDKVNEKSAGYFFGSHEDARETLQAWAEDFSRHLAADHTPIIRVEEKTDGPEWQPTSHAVARLRTVDKLTPLLYILVHLCGGGPPRVTELVGAKMKNVARAKRNVVITKKSLAIVTYYWKTAEQCQSPKPIFRFLDDQTAEALLRFIVYIKPMQTFLLRKINKEGADEDYLFCKDGKFLDESVVYRAFGEQLSSRGVALNVSLYRHYRTGIVKAFIVAHKKYAEVHMLFAQARHSEATARKRYAGMDNGIQGLDFAELEKFYAVSKQWHQLLGITARQKKRTESPEVERAHSVVKRRKCSNVADAQHPTLPSMAGARNKNSRNFSNAVEAQEPVFPSSVLGNAVTKDTGNGLGARNPTPSILAGKETTNFSDNATGVPNPEVFSKMLSAEVVDCCRVLLGLNPAQKVQFSSETQQSAIYECAMQTIVTGYRSSMLVAMPTGSGKTLCWAAPVLREQRLWQTFSMKPIITIIILPVLALQQDVARKCAKYGIRCAEWQDRFNDDVTVVLVSVGIVFTDEYQRLMSAMHAQKRLARIVIDEVHLVLQWKRLRQLGLAGKRIRPKEAENVPLVMMTATAPPTVVPQLITLLGLDR